MFWRNSKFNFANKEIRHQRQEHMIQEFDSDFCIESIFSCLHSAVMLVPLNSFYKTLACSPIICSCDNQMAVVRLARCND